MWVGWTAEGNAGSTRAGLLEEAWFFGRLQSPSSRSTCFPNCGQSTFPATLRMAPWAKVPAEEIPHVLELDPLDRLLVPDWTVVGIGVAALAQLQHHLLCEIVLQARTSWRQTSRLSSNWSSAK